LIAEQCGGDATAIYRERCGEGRVRTYKLGRDFTEVPLEERVQVPRDHASGDVDRRTSNPDAGT